MSPIEKTSASGSRAGKELDGDDIIQNRVKDCYTGLNKAMTSRA